MSTTTSYATAFTVEQSPDEAFSHIINVRGWWTGEIDGPTDHLGAQFTYRHGTVHRSTQTITEFVPGQRLVWHVDDAYLEFGEDPEEWVGSEIVFELAPGDDGAGTKVRFSHIGLVPELECYDNCSSAWGYYVNKSLRELIATPR